jgi:hypothetical protein
MKNTLALIMIVVEDLSKAIDNLKLYKQTDGLSRSSQEEIQEAIRLMSAARDKLYQPTTIKN